jgi:hypothetical protein
MTYAVGGIIQASDYNNFASSVNGVWSTGTTNSGYGQTALSTVSTNSIVYASEVASLLSTISSMASHQGTTLGSLIDSTPVAGDLIYFEPNLATNITLVSNNRLNAATQGSTSTSAITNSSISWSSSLTMTWTIAFSSNNNARYFFNSGGQFSLTASHPSGGAAINTAFNALANNLGTLVLSSPSSGTATIVGVSYNGVTRIGGGGVPTINANNGFYSLTGTNQLLINQAGSGGYYSSSIIQVYARYNGTGTLTIEMLWDEIPDGAIVNTGSVGTLTVRYPETTHISNTWGTPTITTSVTGS